MEEELYESDRNIAGIESNSTNAVEENGEEIHVIAKVTLLVVFFLW